MCKFRATGFNGPVPVGNESCPGDIFCQESVLSVAQIVPRNFVEFGAATLTRNSVVGNHIVARWHCKVKLLNQ